MGEEVEGELLNMSRYSNTPARDQVTVITFSMTVSFECELTVIVGKGSSRPPSRLRPNLDGTHPSAPSRGGKPGDHCVGPYSVEGSSSQSTAALKATGTP